jgi:hypothetical protein
MNRRGFLATIGSITAATAIPAMGQGVARSMCQVWLHPTKDTTLAVLYVARDGQILFQGESRTVVGAGECEAITLPQGATFRYRLGEAGAIKTGLVPAAPEAVLIGKLAKLPQIKELEPPTR